MHIRLTLKSSNRKTGPIPVSTSESSTCPNACPFKGHGCYAELGPLAFRWREVDEGKHSTNWSNFLRAIKGLPLGQLWRHNQAGDLPGQADTLDTKALGELVDANRGLRGFTYTHKPVERVNERKAIASANKRGFTVNLSGNNLEHADKLADMGIGPVVAVLPSTVQGNVHLETPKGRRVVVCPATYRDDVTCDSCRLCAVPDRKVIVGFPAHGAMKRQANEVAK